MSQQSEIRNPQSEIPTPRLGNQYDDDAVLRSYLARVLPADMLEEIEPALKELGRLAGGELYQMQLADRLHEPKLTQWDAWGNRIDQVELTPLWRRAERIAVEFGLVATAYEQKHGSLSRVHQCALAYLFTASTDIYSCPLAMTDGAARTLLSSGNQALIDRAVPHLITRNPKDFWTAGQWMTEITGGSDVGLSQTTARQDVEVSGSRFQVSGADEKVQSPKSNVQSQNAQSEIRNPQSEIPGPQSEIGWRLYGNKWFASAITSQIALTLARPEGNPPGGRGLALFYVETRDEDGRLRHIQIDRLKDKLGTRKVATAELTLAGTPAHLVKGTTDGVRNITPLLNITRLWNGISAAALMRRGLALAGDYARKRVAFGATLSEKPLHLDTLAGLEAEAAGVFHFAFYVAELTGRAETAHEESLTDEALLLRLLTPVMKLTTARQAVMVLSEVVEAFGGAGYVEDTGVAQLLRDAQVLPIWEGTTNVLSLDALRALGAAGVSGFRFQASGADEEVESPKSKVQSQNPQSAIRNPQSEILAGSHTAEATQVGMSQGEEGGLAPALDRGGPTSSIQSQPNPESAGVRAISVSFQAFKAAVTRCIAAAHDPSLTTPVRTTQAALAHAETWLTQATTKGQPTLEAGARRFALTLGRTMELALLIQQAQWSLKNPTEEVSDRNQEVASPMSKVQSQHTKSAIRNPQSEIPVPQSAIRNPKFGYAQRFAQSGIDLIVDLDT